MYAKVIVDVPSAQTDRQFDYEIPDNWKSIVQPGMRVVVPFGPRKIQGFVMSISEQSSYEQTKAVVELLDAEPILADEFLQLGNWLAEETLSFKVSAYQLMIPAALRTKVRKQLKANEIDSLPPHLRRLFDQGKVYQWDDLIKEGASVLSDVQAEVKKGTLEVEYVVLEKGKTKTQRLVQLNMSLEQALSLLTKRANKQIELVHILSRQPAPISIQALLEEGQTTHASLKPLREKGIIKEVDQEVYRDPLSGLQFERTEPLKLTNQQQQVVDQVNPCIQKEKHDVFLLHGVTGSGKTEVYLQVIQQALDLQKEAIMLVPEISLTPQMVNRFKGRFGSEVAVLHSGLSMGEKYDEWRKIKRKEVKVVVGARSAIFAPFDRLGMIIIDEEHETSYKQEENPRYHARDVAIWRAQYHQCPVILGSATPLLETYARAKKEVYHLLTLDERVQNRKMPAVHIVDMREELREGNRSMFSTVLFEKLKDRVANGEQSVLFLNRRGHSTFVMCRDCGYVATCESCDISLTYHRSQNRLKCHYCGHEESMPRTCKSCGSEHIRFFGSGTQKVEEELTRVLPEARVIRMDVDTTRKKGSHERLLSAFEKKQADILLGTQMIAKGLDFPSITLVGVLAADSMLHIPDFRSAERTFQLLEQVSGRAGRHELTGEVVIQSYSPEHYSIDLVKAHDYQAFFQTEMNQRKFGQYPPYVYMTLITISHQELMKVIDVAETVVAFLRRELSTETTVLGPVASPLARIKDRYRYQCMIKYKNEPKLRKVLVEIREHYQRELNKGLQLTIDLQPYLFT
ncbi:primosomal protein N' [Alkalihalobacillus hemicellulosilyticus]|uniref:Replication restart protein PriA n=1 Tax=Halalkalibacter hemicellulosilyticusJCM 9152 TaxID=1236971 RepID=W4QB48_9BACI|nr:primosomal protein N' [Halalkalibacter hemicellulosilyticus]GAE29192.1 helicase PriA essential for oriC/DnaA-independent DNA replication [Halalkalibacter hemicellulosilyticusJCM 9152]